MQLVTLSRNPVPSGAHVGTFKGHDGIELRFARWEATRAPRRGTACLLGGRSEFIEKYFEVIADLRRRGYAVAIMDWRGQGGSARMLKNPRKGHVASFADYDRDLIRFMKDIVLPDCPAPYIAVAHSMGANVLLRAATVSGSWFDRMILTGPMLGIAEQRLGMPTGVARACVESLCLLGLGAFYVPGGSDEAEDMKPFDDTLLTTDPERYARTRAVIEAVPALGLGSPTNAWLRAALRSCARLTRPDYARQIKVPLLLVSAGAEQVISTAAVTQLASRLKMGAHVAIATSRHEILMEREEVRARFWAAFDAYLGLDRIAA